MNIVLIGFMGSGKSTISQELGKRLGHAVIDMDDMIEQKAQMRTPEIFEKFGENRFRELETEVAMEVGSMREIIVATGGGVIVNSINIEYLKQNGGKIIYLHTSFNEIKKRVKNHRRPRPLFTNPEKAHILYLSRLPIYKNVSDIVISTDNKEISIIVTEIIRYMSL